VPLAVCAACWQAPIIGEHPRGPPCGGGGYILMLSLQTLEQVAPLLAKGTHGGGHLGEHPFALPAVVAVIVPILMLSLQRLKQVPPRRAKGTHGGGHLGEHPLHSLRWRLWYLQSQGDAVAAASGAGGAIACRRHSRCCLRHGKCSRETPGRALPCAGEGETAQLNHFQRPLYRLSTRDWPCRP
jgi:hypothetical protein